MRQHPKQRSKLRRGHTHHRAPITESQGAAVPWFEAMADVAMEIDGKAAEGWVSSSSCWLLFVLCGCVLWWTVLSATQHVEIETWSGTSQNGPLLLHHKIKHSAKQPQSNDMYFIVLVWGWGTCLNIWAEKLFWPPFDENKNCTPRSEI